MSLINCPECNKEISDKAKSCPNCGFLIQNGLTEEYLACPICNSKEIHPEKKGFSFGKAITGAFLTGGIGILAGTIGSSDVRLNCLKCGHKFKAGEARVISNRTPSSNPELDGKILAVYKQNTKFLEAATFYQQEAKCDIHESLKYVSELLIKNNLHPKQQQ
jgi:hypothetical protein